MPTVQTHGGHFPKAAGRISAKNPTSGEVGFFHSLLLSAEDAVAGIAETGDYIAVLVEVVVKSCNEDIHIGVILLHTLYALGSADDAHELDVLDAVILEELDEIGRAHV